jgi:hypothetical protein
MTRCFTLNRPGGKTLGVMPTKFTVIFSIIQMQMINIFRGGKNGRGNGKDGRGTIVKD